MIFNKSLLAMAVVLGLSSPVAAGGTVIFDGAAIVMPPNYAPGLWPLPQNSLYHKIGIRLNQPGFYDMYPAGAEYRATVSVPHSVLPAKTVAFQSTDKATEVFVPVAWQWAPESHAAEVQWEPSEINLTLTQNFAGHCTSVFVAFTRQDLGYYGSKLSKTSSVNCD